MARRRPSVASAHADWLRLIETSGPFLSLPVLVQALGHGLDAVESDAKRRLRDAYEEWTGGSSGTNALDEWVRVIMQELLEHEARYITSFEGAESVPEELRHRVDEHAETLCPQLVIHESSGADVESSRLLVCVFPRGQRLDKTVAGSRWAASPQSRMAELCRATGVRLGLVTNGEQWCLVDAPKDETVGYATWYAQLWLDEPDTFAAFRSLLGRHRFFAVGQDETLEALLAKSRENQHEVTDQLGLQVRRAVEMLVRTLDRADQDLGGELLKELQVGEIYEAAVTVMMRLVFLFSAEERGLLLLGDPLFDQYYAVSTLCEQLREVAEQHGEEILERRRDAWCRLLAAFRAVHSGVRHDRLQIPAYGGGLFDPDRFPFLEGRLKGTTWQGSTADPLPVDNRTVLHCLESLQYLQTKIGQHVETRRLSFRALDIEQIGHVYERLLDHTAERAKGPTLGLQGKDGDESEIELAELEALASQSKDKLVERLNKLKVKSSKKSVEKLLDSEVDAARVDRIRQACGSGELWNRVKPFAPLIRDDDFDHPIVILKGQLYATAGQARSDTGTQYTPVSLTQPVVEHSLEPLVYIGPAEGKPREEWNLRTPKEILDLKVCDMACGSGAFLVQACRYLGDRLVEAWTESERRAPEPNHGKLTFPTIDYDGSPAKSDRNLVPKDPDERLLTARRLIAQRCLYGVDINPVAAEMAKLSIWLLTLSKDKPFSFLDHAIRSGDSLLGLHDLEQLRRFSLDRSGKEEVTFNQLRMTELIEKASGTRLQIEQLDSDTIGHVQAQARLLSDAEKQTERLKFAADVLISGFLQPARNASERQGAISSAAVKAGQLVLSGTSDDLREYSARALGTKRPFHWCLEFPEIVNAKEGGGGFDAIIGNPPFIGNKYWGSRLFDGFGEWARLLVNDNPGRSDMVVLFMRRAWSLLSASGVAGLIATSTAFEGDSKRIGPDWVWSNADVFRAESSRPWPGAAGVHVSLMWFSRAAWRGSRILDNDRVDSISPALTNSCSSGDARELNDRFWAFQGSHNGCGECFLLSPSDPWYGRLRDEQCPFLRPYITTDDIATAGLCSLNRWVVDCEDLSLEQVVGRSSLALQFLEQVARPERTHERLSPYKGLAERWWQLWNHRAPLYRELRLRDTCIVIPFVAKYVLVASVPSGWVFTNKLCVLRDDGPATACMLFSAPFELWARHTGGTMGQTTMTLSLSRGIYTFPRPGVSISNVTGVVRARFDAFERVRSTFGPGHTSTLNAMHDANQAASDVLTLRDAQQALDRAVVAAYGWDDLIDKLRHGFYPTKQGERFTIHPDARAEILARLLALNHQRYAEEVAAGLHDKKSGKAKRVKARGTGKSGAASTKGSLFQGKAT